MCDEKKKNTRKGTNGRRQAGATLDGVVFTTRFVRGTFQHGRSAPALKQVNVVSPTLHLP